MPAGICYPRIAGAGVVTCPLWIAGAGTGAVFSMRMWIFVGTIRADTTRCHLYSRTVRFLGVLSSPVGCLPLSMALGFFLLEQGRRCEVMDECASGFAGHPRGLFY
jgi:hypothetical protein